MPPPPPAKDTDTSGNTNASGTAAKPPRDPADKDSNLEGSINGADKIMRLLMMSLAMLCLPTVNYMFSNMRSVYYQSGILEKYSTLSDDTEEERELEVTYGSCWLAACLCLLFALLGHMYYFANQGGAGSGALAMVVPSVQGGATFRIVVMVLYGLGIVVFYAGLGLWLSYRYDESWSTYDDATDDAVESALLVDWGGYWAFPLYCLIVLLQIAFPDKCLEVFECRVAMYATVLFSTLMIWVLFFTEEDYFERYYTVAVEDPEDPFDAAAAFLVMALIWTGGIAAYAGMGAYGIVSGGKDSEASYPTVYKIWVAVAVVLFLIMFALTIAAGSTGVSPTGFALLWVGTLMILADILF